VQPVFLAFSYFTCGEGTRFCQVRFTSQKAAIHSSASLVNLQNQINMNQVLNRVAELESQGIGDFWVESESDS